MRVLLRRHGDGIGDWLLMLQAMKVINAQRPDVELFVDFTLEHRGRVPRILNPLVRQAFECSDVKWKPRTNDDFDVIVPHVVYERLGYEDYAAGMLRCISEATNVALEPDPAILPIYTPTSFRPAIDGRHMAIVSQSKPETSYKDWGLARFETVAWNVQRKTGCSLAQVGGAGDYLLQGSTFRRYLGHGFYELHAVLKDANVIVCLENCIAVLAVHLGKRAACIYPDNENARMRADAPRAVGRLSGVAFTPFVAPTIDAVTQHCLECF